MKNTVLLAWIVIIALTIRIIVILNEGNTVTGDEAVFGLMAKHIISKGELPIFCWGAHYAGALISYISAFFFTLFGVSAYTLRLSNLIFVLGFIIVTYYVGLQYYDERVTCCVLFYLAIPPALLTLFSILVTGGYPEALFFGNMTIFSLYKICFSTNRSKEQTWYSLLGLFTGIGIWISFLVIPYFLVAALFLIIKERGNLLGKKGALFSFTFFLGISPLIFYNIIYPLATFQRAGGRVLNLGREVIASSPEKMLTAVFLALIKQIINIFPTMKNIYQNLPSIIGTDLIPGPFSYLLAILLLTIIVFSVGYLLYTRRQFIFQTITLKARFENATKGDVFIFLFMFSLLFYHLIGLNRARHLLILYSSLPFLTFSFLFSLKKHRMIVLIPAIFLFFSTNIFSNYFLLQSKPVSYNEVISFLLKQGINRAYADYFIAYPITFLSNENIIVSPKGSAKVSERYPAYSREVDDSKEVAYIFKKNDGMNEKFQKEIQSKGVIYKEARINEFLIYFAFSRKVLPEEIQWG